MEDCAKNLWKRCSWNKTQSHFLYVISQTLSVPIYCFLFQYKRLEKKEQILKARNLALISLQLSIHVKATCTERTCQLGMIMASSKKEIKTSQLLSQHICRRILQAQNSLSFATWSLFKNIVLKDSVRCKQNPRDPSLRFLYVSTKVQSHHFLKHYSPACFLPRLSQNAFFLFLYCEGSQRAEQVFQRGSTNICSG